MDKALLIVESPAKARTINKYLGPGYKVMASMGHVRDLPKSKLGVDVENNFEPQYIIIPERSKVVAELKKAGEEATTIILAADPDREGEAICWHLKSLFDGEKKPIYRVRLQEITKHAVEEAVKHMGDLDLHMFEAQQARRVLDRLVGYKISPLLWKKIGRGLSAGRVQSIALRLIVERERERLAFTPEEYWTIFAHLEASLPPRFKATLSKIDGKKAKIADGESARSIVDALKGAAYVVRNINVTEKKRNPAAALHHQHPPAGSLPASPLSGQKDDVRRPEALRRTAPRRARARWASSLTCEPIRSGSRPRPRSGPGRT